MAFRMEIGWGMGKPIRWEVLCDYCPMIWHYSLTLFPDFPAAFKQVVEEGWGVAEDGHGRVRYACPKCEKEKEKEDG